MPLSGTEPSKAAERTPGTARMRASACSVNAAIVSLVYFGGGQAELGRDQVVGIEAELLALHPEEAPGEKRRAHQEHDAQRELDGDEGVAQAPAHDRAAGPVRAAALECAGQVVAGGEPSGHQPRTRGPPTTVMPAEKSSTGQSSPTAPNAGSPPGTAATSAAIAHRATRMPATPPMSESTRLSVRSWRSNRARPAPERGAKRHLDGAEPWRAPA